MSGKTKTRTKAAIRDEPAPAPIVGPQSFGDWFEQTWRAGQKNDASEVERAEFRRLLELRPNAAKLNGDLPSLYRRESSAAFGTQPIVQESITHQIGVLRKDLAGQDPTPLELLLVDTILACHFDYWRFAMVVDQTIREGVGLDAMEKWERILASKETRYLRAIETLARVRRLLNLPAPQVNINLPGGQQVNVSGDAGNGSRYPH